VSTDGTTEPEHPAPVLSLTAPQDQDGAEGGTRSPEPDSQAPDAAQSDAADTATDTASSQDPATDSSSTLSTVLLVGAVGAATLAVAAALAWRRRRG
jgi:hypothetical protein